MSFIKKNIWVIGFIVILGGALLAMALAGKHSGVPSATGTAQDQVSFTIAPDDHVEGAANAKVTLMEFADFQCPACGAYFPLVEQLVKDYPNDLRVVYRYFPLRTIHFQAQNAAQAAEAAGMQGKFWEMYSELYKNQTAWANTSGTSPFDKYASDIGLDMDKFHTDIGTQAVKDRIQRDFDFGLSINVNSTPTFYLDNKKIDNPQSYNNFKALVEKAIASANTTQ